MNNIKNKKSSRISAECQISGSKNLESIIFLGYHPPVNDYVKIGTPADENPSYPCELLYCEESKLVQLGQIVDAAVLFPPEYPYTSSTTKILRENFAELYVWASQHGDLNEVIERLGEDKQVHQLTLQRVKKRKLAVRNENLKLRRLIL